GDPVFKQRLIAYANMETESRILDLGCGTATLGLLLVKTVPGATVVGIDGDPAILGLAQTKARTGDLPLHLSNAFVNALPIASGSMDYVVSSLLFHHLDTATKQAAFAECLRVLKPGGGLYVVDWGRPSN